MTTLILGPLLRYVDDATATVWVETAEASEVTVVAGEHRAAARTFGVHGRHYALVELTGLPPGSRTPYVVRVDDVQVWPSADPDFADFPPSVISTLQPGKPLRVAFGSCRVSVDHDEAGTEQFGVDAMRAYALYMAGITESGSEDPGERWPDLALFLGDQVYADETSDEMRAFIQQRRDPEQPPWFELKDYEEYAHLYRLAWTDPANRWLLSTLPTAMIFDDHDIRDDWNTSWTWRQDMEATSWWHDRIVGGLASYWVHQHLGNLGPEERAADELWKRITAYDGPGELDVSDAVDALADRADQHPETYRWSYSRDFDTQARLVVVDSRAARVLEPERRSMLDDGEMLWLDAQLQGDVDHLLVGTSLPYLLAPGLHHIESFGEAIAEGAWGGPGRSLGEWARKRADLEHWGAFERGFRDVAGLVLEVAAGRRGRAPRTITFLSGDVHHSYVAEAWPRDGQVASRILQAVCSPIRNPLPRGMRGFTALAARRATGKVGRLLSLAGRVPREPIRWSVTEGPWYDNNLAVLELAPAGLRLWWNAGEVVDDPERPLLTRVATVDPIG
ncbi:glycoside hydrolase [Nocardioides sp. Root1257]|uniref:alkaline phosphatase D family protein n=1 Tax=unclassified Nocardioides TaxID=2615069 RepID=UPI0006FF0D7C|nr:MULTISPECIES: alkaline phosphatase D family protein [unclassified Nocardioides]KQW53818.1 glycoside hydrolase [Nocardioides sp. Root1257]KRC56505.1 glycoside hydrolase [Nocardioides sp. Root224]